jgi:hypothetical protein
MRNQKHAGPDIRMGRTNEELISLLQQATEMKKRMYITGAFQIPNFVLFCWSFREKDII